MNREDIEIYLKALVNFYVEEKLPTKPPIIDMITYFKESGEDGEKDIIYTSEIMAKDYTCIIKREDTGRSRGIRPIMDPDDPDMGLIYSDSVPIYEDKTAPGKETNNYTFQNYFYLYSSKLDPPKPYVHYKFLILKTMQYSLEKLYDEDKTFEYNIVNTNYEDDNDQCTTKNG